MIKTTCPHCGEKQNVPDNYVGKAGRCVGCYEEFDVRDPAKASKSEPKLGGKGKLLAIVGSAVLVVAVGVSLFGGEKDEVVEPAVEAPVVTMERVEVKDPSRSKLFAFLDAGTTMRNLTEQDPTYDELKEDLAYVLGSWDLAKSEWPANLPDETAFNSFERSVVAWYACSKLWKLQREKQEYPTEPDINDWDFFSTTFSGELVTRIQPRNYEVREYRGRAYLPFDENIEALLKMGAENFEEGKDRIFQQIK
jgi:hypothetical protein